MRHHHYGCGFLLGLLSDNRRHPSRISPISNPRVWCMNSHSNNNNAQAQEDFEQFPNGVRTKFGRRARRNSDKVTKNARVRNSFLKLVMDDEDAVFDQLNNLVRQTKHQWDASITNGHHKTTISKKQSKRQLTIMPRTRNSLHMTYFFAGKVLEEMASDELQRWESFVRQCSDGLFSGGECFLRFKSLETFPPRKQNLIVAVFESSMALDVLYDELCNVAVMEKKDCDDASGDGRQEYEFPLLRDLTRKHQKQRKQHNSPGWIAHVTLGNLVGGSQEDVRRLSEWLSNRNHTGIDDTMGLEFTSEEVKLDNACLLKSNISAIGLALGGPVPRVDIDWNFP